LKDTPHIIKLWWVPRIFNQTSLLPIAILSARSTDTKIKDVRQIIMSFDSFEFITLLISIAIEVLIVWVLGRIWKLDWRLLAIVATASTLITHPILWQVFNNLLPTISMEYVPQERLNYLAILLEIPVVIIEGCMYKWVMKYSWQSSLVLSFLANLASYLFGICFMYLVFDW
jgi:hypothetical protein